MINHGITTCPASNSLLYNCSASNCPNCTFDNTFRLMFVHWTDANHPAQQRPCSSNPEPMALDQTCRRVSVSFVGPCLPRTLQPRRLRLLWSGQRAPQSICTCDLARSAQASLSGRAHQRMQSQLTLVRKPHTKLSTVCAPLCVPPTLALSADSEVVLERPQVFDCCLVLFICMMRRRLCSCAMKGCLCNWHHEGWRYERIQPQTYSLACQLPSDNVPSSSQFGFTVLSCVTPFTHHLIV